MDATSFGFPFKINESGGVTGISSDENIRAKIIQVLFTSPGERVNMPDFGCGLRDLIFEPNNPVLAATTDFNITAALERWLGEDILVEDVEVTSDEEKLGIVIVYTRRDRLERQVMKINY